MEVQNMNKKKYIAIGTGALLLGALVAGCSVSKQDTIDQQQTQLAELSAKLNESKVQLDESKAQIDSSAQKVTDLEKQNADVSAILDGLKLELDEKDKSLLEYEKKIADEKDLEEAELVDDLALGETVSAVSANHYDVSFLKKGTVTHDGDSYDVEEQILLTSLKVATSLSDDEELADKPYLYFTDEGSVSYALVFKDEFEYADVSEEEPLTVQFADRTLTVVEVDEVSLKYKDARSYFVKEGETVSLGNESSVKAVTVKAVTNNKVLLEVNGSSVTVSEGQTKSFGDVEVRVKETLYKGYAGAENFVELDIGRDVLRTVSDGDEYVEDDDTYVWSLVTDDGKLVSLGVRYDVKADDPDEDVLKAGESLKFLNYFKLKFDFEEDYEYQDTEFSLTTVTEDDVPAVKVDAGKDGLKVGSKRLDRAYLTASNTTFYKEDGDWKSTNDTLSLVNDDFSLTLTYQSGHVVAGSSFKFATDFDKLGTTKKEAEAADVLVGSIGVGNWEESVLLSNGVVVKDPEANSDKDKVSVSLPNKVVKAALYLLNK